jgi:HD-like signal output (HDOD) protein
MDLSSTNKRLSARDIAEQAAEIFVLDDSFIRIKQLIDDEKSTIDDIADVILIDPALTVVILKLANSALFNYPGKIDSVSKALLVLGITEVYNLVIAYFTTKAYSQLTVDKKVLEAYWELSIDTALLVKYFGQCYNLKNNERLFILGLLHQVGEVLTHQFLPEQYRHYHQLLIAEQNKATPQFPWQLQQQVFGYTFADCSAELMRFWRLPFSLIEPVIGQDDDNFECLSSESKVLLLAKRVALNLHFPAYKFSQLFNKQQQQILQLNKQLLANGLAYCHSERLALLAMLSPASVTIY